METEDIHPRRRNQPTPFSPASHHPRRRCRDKVGRVGTGAVFGGGVARRLPLRLLPPGCGVRRGVRPGEVCRRDRAMAGLAGGPLRLGLPNTPGSEWLLLCCCATAAVACPADIV